jgi:hypothetical protein
MRILSWNLVRIFFLAPFILSAPVLKHLGTRTGPGQYLNTIRAQLYDAPAISMWLTASVDGTPSSTGMPF